MARLHPLQNILVEQVAEGAIDGEVDAVERLVVFDAVAHDLARHAVRVAEGHALLHQVVGDVRRRRIAAHRRGAHLARVKGDVLQQFVEDGKAALHRLFGVEQRLLVFLQVLVVGGGDALDDGQNGHEAPVHPPRLAADEFGDVGVFLLRHDGRTGGVVVGDVDEAEFVRRIGDDVLAEARKVRHHRRAGEDVFRNKISVGNGVQRVLADAGKVHQFCRHSAVDGEVCARQGAAAEGHHVRAAEAVGKALDVAQKHLAVGVQVLRRRNGLRPAHVRVAGHDVAHVAFGKFYKRLDERAQQGDIGADAVLHIQAEICRHLVVARARRVHALAHHADALDKFLLDEGMDILRPLDGKRPALDVLQDLLQGVADLFRLLFGQNIRLAQHLDVRDAGKNVVPVQLFVKRKRLVEDIRVFGAGLGKTSFPQFHGCSLP